jgi:hypothetical protein
LTPVTHDIPQLDRAGLRKFGLTTGGIVAALFGLLLPWIFDRSLPLWPWIVCGILAALAVAAPTALGPIYRGWMKIGNVLGWINTRIILALLFFVVLFPVGLLRRLFGRDPMHRKLDAHADSYRVPSTPQLPKNLERPF